MPTMRHLTSNIITLLISAIILVNVANSQSIQGYVYWDQNGNGNLEENFISHELENGLVDVTVSMKSCGGDDGEGEVYYSCVS